MSNKPVFKNMSTPAMPPIPDANKVAGAVAAFALKTNVPSLAYPNESAPATPAQAETIEQPALKIVAPKEPKTAKPATTKYKRLAVFLPDYLVDEIHKRALESTARFVTLHAFKKAGFHVASEDMVEDRRSER